MDADASPRGELRAELEALRQRNAEQERHVALAEERLTLLIAASGTLLRSPNFEDVLPNIMSLARQLVDADAYAVWRRGAHGEWSVACAHGLSEAYQHEILRALDQGPQQITSPLEIADVAAEQVAPARLERYRGEGIRALMVMPLQVRGQPDATLAFYYRQPHAFTEFERRSAAALANLAAAALTNAALYEEQRQLRLQAEQAQLEQSFLSQASAALGDSLDYEASLQSIARLTVPFLAEWCAIYIADDAESVRPLVVEHHDPAKRALADALFRDYPPASSHGRGLLGVLHSGQPLLMRQVDESILQQIARDATHRRLLDELAFVSYMLIPMSVRGKMLGVLALATSDAERRFSPSQFALAQELSQRCAVAIDNARLYAEVQEAVRARDQFMSIAAHELKTPVTSLLGYAQLLQRRVDRDPAASDSSRRAIHSIAGQTARLNRLTLSLLDLSRLDRGTLALERHPVDLCALAQRVGAELQPTTDRHSILTSCAVEPVVVLGDDLRLEQVIYNLVQNGIKYTPEGGPVEVQVEVRDNLAVIMISDQGMGIPAADLPRLFDRFFRASNINTSQISGMGLGLYIIKEIVSLHEGTVGVHSEEGAGSTFFVSLPLYQELGAGS